MYQEGLSSITTPVKETTTVTRIRVYVEYSTNILLLPRIPLVSTIDDVLKKASENFKVDPNNVELWTMDSEKGQVVVLCRDLALEEYDCENGVHFLLKSFRTPTQENKLNTPSMTVQLFRKEEEETEKEKDEKEGDQTKKRKLDEMAPILVTTGKKPWKTAKEMSSPESTTPLFTPPPPSVRNNVAPGYHLTNTGGLNLLSNAAAAFMSRMSPPPTTSSSTTGGTPKYTSRMVPIQQRTPLIELPPLRKVIANPIYNQTDLKQHITALGGVVKPNVTNKICTQSNVKKTLPPAIQGFLDSWEGGKSPTFSIIAKSSGLKKYVTFITDTIGQNYVAYDQMVLIGVGSFWLYASLTDTDPIFGFYLVPSTDIDGTKTPLGPYPITGMIKNLILDEENGEHAQK